MYLWQKKIKMEKLYLFYNFFPKFYLNQTSIITKKEKNLIQKEASKFSSVSKFHINILQLEKVSKYYDVLLIKRKVSVIIRLVILSNNNNLL